MEIKYEIFGTEQEGIEKTNKINTLLGYPKGLTLRYRKVFSGEEITLYAGAIDQLLIDACLNMTPDERILYYNDTDLKTYQYMEDNGFDPNS
jgi:hypothetical protein